jgi:hypothetical protein
MNRRLLLKGAIALAGGLLLPPSLVENAEAVTRYWVLDRTHLAPRIPEGWTTTFRGPDQTGMAAIELGAWHVSGATYAERVDLRDLGGPGARFQPYFMGTDAWAAEVLPQIHLRWGLGALV